jgi:hypothetical protein
MWWRRERSLMGEERRANLRPAGLSGWVMVATTWTWGLERSQWREGRPISPVPMKMTRINEKRLGWRGLGGD